MRVVGTTGQMINNLPELVATDSFEHPMLVVLTAAGLYAVHIELDARPIVGSPFSVLVAAGAPNLASTQVVGGNTFLSVDYLHSVSFTTRDEFGNFVMSSTAVSALMSGAAVAQATGPPSVAAGKCSEAGHLTEHLCLRECGGECDGLSLQFRIRKVGALDIFLVLGEIEWHAANFTVVAGAPNFMSSTVAAGDCVDDDAAVAGKFGRMGLDTCAEVRGAGGCADHPAAADAVVMCPITCQLSCGAVGVALPNVTAGRVGEFTVLLRDQYANPIPVYDAGRAAYNMSAVARAVAANGAYVFANATAAQDAPGWRKSGTMYTGSFAPTVAGLYNLGVHLNGKDFGAVPVLVHAAEPSFPHSDLRGSGLRNGMINQQQHILLTLKDHFGNPGALIAAELAVTVSELWIPPVIVNETHIGCMNPSALNYDRINLQDDGGCIFNTLSYFKCPVDGFLVANNLDSSANGAINADGFVPDISAAACTTLCYDTPGCKSIDYSTSLRKCYLASGVAGIDGQLEQNNMDWQYYEQLTMRDGGQVTNAAAVRDDPWFCRYGCTHRDALDFNPTAEMDSGTCTSKNYGCDDPHALNYNASANVNDRSCVYTELARYSCPVPGALSGNNIPIGGRQYIEAETQQVCAELCSARTASPRCASIDYSAVAKRCYMNSGIAVRNGPIIPTATYYYYELSADDSIVCHYGCTKPDAFNYNPLSMVNDGTCVSPPTVTVTALADGTYDVRYSVEKSGNYTINMTVRARPGR
jgi:hypothetical protein